MCVLSSVYLHYYCVILSLSHSHSLFLSLPPLATNLIQQIIHSHNNRHYAHKANTSSIAGLIEILLNSINTFFLLLGWVSVNST